MPNRIVITLLNRNMGWCSPNADPRVAGGVFPGNLKRTVCAAVIGDRVIPVRVGLGKHALDAGTKVRLPVIDRGYDADWWLISHGFGIRIQVLSMKVHSRRGLPGCDRAAV